MKTRARTRWLGLAIAVAMCVAGCAETKPAEAPREAAPSVPPCEAAMSAMETLRAQAGSGDAKAGVQDPGQQRSFLPVEVLRTRNLLRREGSRCYELRLADLHAIESTDRRKAVEGYGSLKGFIASLRSFGVDFPVVDFDAKIAALKQIDSDAEEAYGAAEAAMRARRFEEAIALYRRSLDLVPNYMQARPRIAECSYELAVDATRNQRYRQAAQLFLQAEQYQPTFKDSQTRAARIRVALGDYFLARGYPRNAVLEYAAAESAAPDFPGVRSRSEAARAQALDRVALVGLGNRTGATIGGMAVERILADGIFDTLQKKKSQFLELYPRATLEVLPAELRLAWQENPGPAATQVRERLAGVRYLVAGRLTGVTERRGEPVRARRERSVQVPVIETVTEVDQAGRSVLRQKQVGTQVQTVQYDEITWSAEIAVAGSLDVLDVLTGRIVLSRHFDKRESGGGRWAENPSVPGIQSQLSAEAQTLVQATSSDAIARRALDGLAEELAIAILEKIDSLPSVPDPTMVLAELQEPAMPAAVAAPPAREQPTGPPPSPTPAPQQQVKVKADVVNIRLGPSTQDQVLGRAKRGEVFPLVSKQKDWVKIRLADGREAWIAERLVEILQE